VKPIAPKTWQFNTAPATLLAAYLLVLQGIALGFAVGVSPGSSGLFSGSICFSRGGAPSQANPSAPARSSHQSDVCCVIHCSGFGDATVAGPVSPMPPIQSIAEILTPFSVQHGFGRPATPPLGSRAPPVSVA
jgi:hypothetical protein